MKTNKALTYFIFVLLFFGICLTLGSCKPNNQEVERELAVLEESVKELEALFSQALAGGKEMKDQARVLLEDITRATGELATKTKDLTVEEHNRLEAAIFRLEALIKNNALR